MQPIRSLTLTHDGRRAVVLKNNEIWSEQKGDGRTGRHWQKLSKDGLPDLDVIELHVSAGGVPVVMLRDFSLWELPTSQWERSRWRQISTEGLPL